MSLRHFRGTPAFLLLGLLQGCAGGKQSVPAPSQRVQASQTQSEDQIRQDAVDETARLAMAEGHDLTHRIGSTSKYDVAKPQTHSDSMDANTAQPPPGRPGAIALSAVPLGSRDPDVLTDMGILALQKGDLVAAEKSLRAALAIDPAHRRALLHLAQTLSREGRQEESAQLFGAAKPVATNSSDPALPPVPRDDVVPPAPPQSATAAREVGLPLRCDLAEARIPPQHVERDPLVSVPRSVDPTLPPVPPASKAPAVFDLPPARSAVPPPATPSAPHAPMALAEEEEMPAILPTPASAAPVYLPAPTPAAIVPVAPPVPPPAPPQPPAATNAVGQVGEALTAPTAPQQSQRKPLAKLHAPEAEEETPAKVLPPVVKVASPVVETEEKPVIVTPPSQIVVAEPDAKVAAPMMPPSSAPEPRSAPVVPPAPVTKTLPAPVPPAPPLPTPVALPIPMVSTQPIPSPNVATGPELPPAPTVSSPMVPVTSPTLLAVPPTEPARLEVTGPVLPPAPVEMSSEKATHQPTPKMSSPIIQTSATQPATEKPEPAPVVAPRVRAVIIDVKAE